MLCGEIGKPVHALVLRGVTPAVDVGEVHMIALDTRWETEHDLQNWAGSLNQRFGKPRLTGPGCEAATRREDFC
jgi:hypothetical protein